MTDFEIEPVPFQHEAIRVWGDADERRRNWPVVYTIFNDNRIYVGETSNAASRLRQHLDDPAKSQLKQARIVLDETFNRSVCHDLESRLISYFAADEKFAVINNNAGITDANYYQRSEYRDRFDEIFTKLLDEGLLTRSIPDIVNSDLFKYSPFKALNTDQSAAIEEILETLFSQWESGTDSPMVVQGDPGTGKTIVAIYLIKLLHDIAACSGDDDLEKDSAFVDFFQDGYRETVQGLKVGFVIPQKSLRETVQKVFKRTPGLSPKMVIDPFKLKTKNEYDLLVVDEAHRLGQRANQSAGTRNKEFPKINEALLGRDYPEATQLDWVRAASRHQLLMIDALQAIRPGDLGHTTVRKLLDEARLEKTLFRLHSQMRVAGGNDYIKFIGDLLNLEAASVPDFGDYDFRIFDNFADMRQAIRDRNDEIGLSRVVAGYAWPWVSKVDKIAFDIEIDGEAMQWNTRATDWVASPTAVNEVGSIHTIQGYDLNYAGVIIGPDLGYDPVTKSLVFHRENYYDKKGKENNKQRGISYTDDDLLEFVKNIYRVLLTRGIRGTFVFISDPHLRTALDGLTKRQKPHASAVPRR